MPVRGSRYTDLYATQLNGSSQYAYVVNPTWKSDTAGCFAGWVYLDSLLGSNGTKGIIGYGVNSGSNDSMFIIRQLRSAVTSNQNRFQNANRLTNGGTTITNNGDTSLSAGTWYHLVVQSTGTTTSMYVNDVAQTLSGTNSGNWMGDISGTDHTFVFGTSWSSNAASAFIDGKVNEWIYVGGRALSAGEVAEHYNSGVPKSVRSLTFVADVDSYWRFGDRGDTASTTILDRIGTNHLTTVATPTFVTP